MFVTTSGRSGAPKAYRTTTYVGTIIYNDSVVYYKNKDESGSQRVVVLGWEGFFYNILFNYSFVIT
jgi:hypothetical protein